MNADLKSLQSQVEKTEKVYRRQLSTAMKIVPDLETFHYFSPAASFEHELGGSAASESINFYRHFSDDLLSYKILRWISNGGKTCYTGGNDTFKFYPEIGVLTALNIKKISDLIPNDEDNLNLFIEANIKKLLLKIDIMFGLYNCDINSETEAYKKLHKFQLLNNIAKALMQLNMRDVNHPLVQSLTKRAVQEIEECLDYQERLSLQVKLTAIGCYALQLSAWGQHERAMQLTKRAIDEHMEFDPHDLASKNLVN